MPSHLNAYNMPVPESVESTSEVRAKRPWLLVVLGVAAFFALDRSMLLFVPAQYRSIADIENYHTLYYSLKFRQFKRIKNQLEVILVGDSRTRHGVNPALFNGQSKELPVTAFNFAPASSGIEFTDLLVREYLSELGSLKTIVWGVSPRIFNRYWHDEVYELFRQSQGYRADCLVRRAGFSRDGIKAGLKLWTYEAMVKISAAFAHRSKLKSIFLDRLDLRGSKRHFYCEPVININRWGFMEFPESQVVDVSDANEVEKFLASIESGRFDLDQDRLRKFQRLIEFLRKRNIRLVCFVPPMHHSLKQSLAADADGTPNKAYEGLVTLLKSFEAKFGNYHFIDINKGGDNGFTDAEYGDFEHLNRAGSRRLSRIIDEYLQRVCAIPVKSARGTTVGQPAETSPIVPTDAQVTSTLTVNKGPKTSVKEDRIPPEIRSHLGKLNYRVGAYPPDNRPLIWVRYFDTGSGIDVNSVRLFMDGEDITARCKVTDKKISYKPAKTLKAPKLYRFKVIVSDKAGNRSELVWEILLKPC